MPISNLVRPGFRQSTGYFRLMALNDAILDGEEVVLAEMRDASGVAERVVVTVFADRLRDARFVHGTLLARPDPGPLLANAYELRKVDAGEIPNAAAMLRLGSEDPRVVDAFWRLVTFIESIHSAPLKAFVNRVLLDEAVIDRFGVVPASFGPHHAFPGGLLVHSTGQLAMVSATICHALREKSSDVALVTQIGYLFHDLAKVETHAGEQLTEASRNEIISRLMQPHLEWLRTHYRAAMLALHQIFDVASLPGNQRYRPTFFGADIVIACDALSVVRERESNWSKLLSGPSANDRTYKPPVRYER